MNRYEAIAEVKGLIAQALAIRPITKNEQIEMFRLQRKLGDIRQLICDHMLAPYEFGPEVVSLNLFDGWHDEYILRYTTDDGLRAEAYIEHWYHSGRMIVLVMNDDDQPDMGYDIEAIANLLWSRGHYFTHLFEHCDNIPDEYYLVKFTWCDDKVRNPRWDSYTKAEFDALLPPKE